jgi:hypothetical protein
MEFLQFAADVLEHLAADLVPDSRALLVVAEQLDKLSERHPEDEEVFMAAAALMRVALSGGITKIEGPDRRRLEGLAVLLRLFAGERAQITWH